MTHRIVFDFHIPNAPRIWISRRDTNTALWMFQDTAGVDRPMIGDDAGNVFLLDEDGTFAKDGQTADAKSIMDVLMPTGTKDSRLKVSAEGKDEEAAIDEVVGLIQDKFGEGE